MSVQQACKPGSVSFHRWKDGDHPSSPPVAGRVMRPTRGSRTGRPAPPKAGALLFGLAPGGVYPNRTVTSTTVRSYRTIAPLPSCEGGMFLWHFPSPRGAWKLSSTLPGGARTFLPSARERAATRPPEHSHYTGLVERLLHFSGPHHFRLTSPLPINDLGNSDSLAPLSLKRES